MIKQRLVIAYDPSVQGRLKVSRQYMVSHNDAVDYAFHKSVELKSEDKIFCLPDTTIPRFKLQGLYEKYGFRSVKNINDANYIFIGPKSKGKSNNLISSKQVTYERYYIIENIQAAYMFQYAFDPANVIYAPDAVNEIMDNHSAVFVMSESDASVYREYVYKETGHYVWFRYSFSRENFISLPEPSLYSKLRSEEHLLNLLSSESIVITDQKFEELQRMFDSNVDENIILAMEIMANSNYHESILNNYFLLNKNSYKIRRLKEANHKNFKSLLNFFNLELSQIGGRFSNYRLESLTSFLKDYGKFTEEAMYRMLQEYAYDNSDFRGTYYNAVIRPNEDLTYDE